MEPEEEIQITGLGTKESPYIVNTWQQFLEKCSTVREDAKEDEDPTVFIKFADKTDDPLSKVVDCNEIYREGVGSPIQIYADVDFNGWTIKNLFNDISKSTSTIPIINLKSETKTFTDSNTKTYTSPAIRKCNFENICVKTPSGGLSAIFLKCVPTSSSKNNISVEQCNFSATLENNTNFHQGEATYIYNSYNIKVIGKPATASIFYTTKLKYCNIRIEHDNYQNKGTSFKYFPSLDNCYIEGYIHGDTTDGTLQLCHSSSIRHSVFNMELKGVCDNNQYGLFENCEAISVINKDLINFDEFLTYTNSSGGKGQLKPLLKPVTTEDLRDAMKLAELGFPVLETMKVN